MDWMRITKATVTGGFVCSIAVGHDPAPHNHPEPPTPAVIPCFDQTATTASGSIVQFHNFGLTARR
jgi:hypothetical protein